jgi:hypothetical protein
MGSELNAVESWLGGLGGCPSGKDWGDYRTGVRFGEISPEDMSKLKVEASRDSSPGK